MDSSSFLQSKIKHLQRMQLLVKSYERSVRRNTKNIVNSLSYKASSDVGDHILKYYTLVKKRIAAEFKLNIDDLFPDLKRKYCTQKASSKKSISKQTFMESVISELQSQVEKADIIKEVESQIKSSHIESKPPDLHEQIALLQRDHVKYGLELQKKEKEFADLAKIEAEEVKKIAHILKERSISHSSFSPISDPFSSPDFKDSSEQILSAEEEMEKLISKDPRLAAITIQAHSRGLQASLEEARRLTLQLQEEQYSAELDVSKSKSRLQKASQISAEISRLSICSSKLLTANQSLIDSTLTNVSSTKKHYSRLKPLGNSLDSIGVQLAESIRKEDDVLLFSIPKFPYSSRNGQGVRGLGVGEPSPGSSNQNDHASDIPARFQGCDGIDIMEELLDEARVEVQLHVDGYDSSHPSIEPEGTMGMPGPMQRDSADDAQEKVQRDIDILCKTLIDRFDRLSAEMKAYSPSKELSDALEMSRKGFIALRGDPLHHVLEGIDSIQKSEVYHCLQDAESEFGVILPNLGRITDMEVE
ncbi:hypothetical protein ADUPG1_012078 [Aduncisulcus paluster]|uniref:Uncharacterized protein n=1 Tax=Aduncisulcus paluster TaxID=2918883 RepID=A0ABQ5JY76_9EUKA|nr:hypothetical protein ADUPG1_012078 [Aduncisulcus paluster]